MTKIIQRGFREDSLVCGSCQANFPFGNFTNFVQHKQFDCEELSEIKEALACHSCPAEFGTPWSLLMHAQKVHALKIYFERSPRNFPKDFELERSRINGNQAKDFEKLSVLVEESVKKSAIDQAQSSELCVPGSPGAAPAESSSVQDGQTTPLADNISAPFEKTSLKVSSNEAGSKNMGIQVEIVKDDKTDSNRSSANAQSSETPNIRPSDTALKKCCSSVVPKKRKRHMETKHMVGGVGSGSLKGRRRLGSPDPPTSIYIDFDAQDEFSSKCGDDQFNSENCFVGDSENSRSTTLQDDEHLLRQPNTGFYPSMKQRSVIIQPGMTFSIPVSYNVGMEPSVAIYSSAVPPSVVFSRPQDENAMQSEVCHNMGRKFQQPNTPMSSDAQTDEKNRGGQALFEDMNMSQRQHFSLDNAAVKTSVGESERETGFGMNSPSDAQRQKKRRYPTSRPFKCDQCDDSFNQRIHLQKHQSKHTGVKPFKCDRCDYSTVERSHLKVHIRVHTGEKPYKCTYCGYATAQNSTLKIHLKRHHLTSDGINVFTCSTCGMVFEQQERFHSHSVQEHSNTGSDDRQSSFEIRPPQSASCGKPEDETPD